MAGHLLTMPILIVNMGGEMVYILEQRLQAQNIPQLKGQKVLNDVVRTMYFPRFMEELFKPQPMYSVQSTRQVFDRLAHSSIMRLNESSMDKLFDLMAMGFKNQVISCASPQELLDVTHNHLDVLRNLVGDSASTVELVDQCAALVHDTYSVLSLFEFCVLRHTLCTFFQDKKIKVSLFLNDQTQNSDGSIVVPSGGMLPATTQMGPGTVRYFSGGQEIRRHCLPVISSHRWSPHSGVRTNIGANVYDVEPRAGSPAPQSAAIASQPVPGDVAAATRRMAAVSELNSLASLIGPPPSSLGGDHFKLENIFGGDMFGGGSGPGADVIQIDGRAPCEHHHNLDAVRQQFEFGTAINYGDPAPELLDLMDNL